MSGVDFPGSDPGELHEPEPLGRDHEPRDVASGEPDSREAADRDVDAREPEVNGASGPDAEFARPDDEIRRAIEAVLIAATEPVEPRFLAELVELPVDDVLALCQSLADEYEDSRRGFVLTRVNGGYRLQTHPDLAPYVEHFVLEGQHVRLSGPALETLAIVAYKQPISRAQISAIRGVNVETTLQTLVQRGYVSEISRDPGPGLAVLYGTTPLFLERLGLDSLHELLPLGDFVPDAGIVAALEHGLRISDDATASESTEPVDG